MVKEPRPGRVKTRLARDIGTIEAAWWFRRQVAGLLRRLRDPRWDIALAVAPDRAGMAARLWPPDLTRHPQGRGQLGVRMLRQLNAYTGPVCLIGADIPAVSRDHIALAFQTLRRADVVFGPAQDGGYWLIGCAAGRRLPGFALQDVRWSSPKALADSKRGLHWLGILQVAQLRDVDTVADLPRQSTLSRVTRPGARDRAAP